MFFMHIFVVIQLLLCIKYPIQCGTACCTLSLPLDGLTNGWMKGKYSEEDTLICEYGGTDVQKWLNEKMDDKGRTG